MTHPALRTQLGTFRDQLEQRQQARRQERALRKKEGAKPLPPVLPNTSLSLDFAIFFRHIANEVETDRYRFMPEKIPAPYAEGQEPPNGFSAPIRVLWDQWAGVSPLIPPYVPPLPNPEDAETPQQPAHPSAHMQCYHLLLAIIAPLLDDTANGRPPLPANMVIKLRQAVQSFAENRIKDASTLLRNAAQTDPHNPHILILLSQIAYYAAITESPNSLPEARELAQRCMTTNDRIPPETQLLYRYLCLTTERALGPEKVLEWLTQHDLLNPAHLMGPEGLFAGRGIYLRLWALMGTIPIDLWKEADMAALARLTLTVVGGGALFMAWFKPMLQGRHSAAKPPLPGQLELEKMMQTAQSLHAETASALRQMPLPASEFPWLLRVRYLHTLVKVMPVPAFDQTLCHVAVNGSACTEEGFPNSELRALLHDYSLVYWNLWALSITPDNEARMPYLIPADETQTDGDMLAQCDALLKTLKEGERQRIKPHLWDDLKPWMARWQLDHLLATATGSNRPRSRFAPNLAPYTHFYRHWQNPAVQGYLTSDVIQETARRGGFASLFEVVAAFEGANRLIDDPVHGIVAVQKRALAAANKANPKRFRGVQTEFGRGGGATTLSYLLPLGGAGLVAAIISFSSNWGQAAGLILAALGVAGVIMLNLSTHPSDES